MVIRPVVLLCLVIAAAAWIPQSPTYLQKKLYRQRADAKNNGTGYVGVDELWFTQKTDHFDPTSTATWQQKYYYNPDYSRNTSIIFLMIGGEGPETPHWAGDPDVQYLQWAREFGAVVFDLEHRFFGDSWPIKDMEVSTLRLLTTQQAMSDLAFFITSMNQKYGFNNPRWVTFGGSYPGALNAWFRSKYPELTVGAVASSAPINLKLDFYEYAMVVQDDLMLTDPNCADVTRQAFQKIQQLSMTIAGRAQLTKQFHLDPAFIEPVSKLAITNFFANVFTVFQGMTQYTYDGQSNKTHSDETDARLCTIMTDTSVPDPVDRVYNLYLWMNKISGDPTTTMDNTYSGDMSSIHTGNLTKLGSDGASARGWMWLCCNELGYLQTTDQGNNIFGATVPVNYYMDMCTDIFDSTIAADHIYNTNLKAQQYYGGADLYTATNIVLPNGSLDPWHALGTYINTTASLTPLLINGTAHCSDMYPSYVGEPPALAPARAIIKAQVQQFIRYDPVLDGPKRSSFVFSVMPAMIIAVLSLIQ